MSEPFRNLVELHRRSTERWREQPALGTRTPQGWVWTTFGQLAEQVDHFRAGLAQLGITPGDRVAIVSNNRVEWAVTCYAVYGLGAELVPMYEAQLPKEWAFILRDSGARLVVGSTTPIYSDLCALRPEIPSLAHVVGMDLPDDDPASFRAVLARGASSPVAARDPDPGEVAGFIYTSGTTGNPKGVVLTHHNIASNISAVQDLFPFGPDDRSLSFLPWAHSYGQVAELHGLLSMGASLALNNDVSVLLEQLSEVKPTILVAVPRIFNRLYDKVHEEIADWPHFLQSMFEAGIRNATRRARGEHLGPLQGMGLTIDDKILFSRIRDKLGGRLKYAISASAALSLEVAEFIDALGIPVYEGYGLTETSPIVAANYPGHRKIGSVGQPIEGVRVEIDRSVTGDPVQGEIIVHGPNVMQGYHDRPEENAKAFTEDGGLRTGDLGHLDADGYLYITGRIKEQYKLETGKYVMPSPLEEELKLSHFIANVMLYGENRPYNVALVVPDLEAVKKWSSERGFELVDMASDERVRTLIEVELTQRSRGFKSFERPRRYAMTLEDFTTDNDLLTPTLKLKRRNVLARYRDVLEALFG